MLHASPLRAQHEAWVRSRPVSDGSPAAVAQRPGAASGRRSAAEVEYLPYGVAADAGGPTCEIVASYGEPQAEYAAIRRGCGVFDATNRGTLLVTGKDRRGFLNRMLTQELKDLEAGAAKPSFWLNRKGRIEADLNVIELGDRMLIDLDIHQAASTVKTLGDFLFSEDVEIKDVSAPFHHIALHGRLAGEVLAAASHRQDVAIEPGRALAIVIDGVEVVVMRQDLAGEPGYELIAPYDAANLVWEFLLATDHPVGQDKRRVRPIGWHAFNIARLEAGTPLFNIDFGPTNLPHETGILRKRVSFTKGCYLGQEIVARMESLGRPKQTLVGLTIQEDALPVAGGQVFERGQGDAMGPEIGVVTSSTLSPMRGAAPIALAMLKTAHASTGASVLVNAEGRQTLASVTALEDWSVAGTPSPAGEKRS